VALSLFNNGNHCPSKKEICQGLYNGHSNIHNMRSFNLLRTRNLLVEGDAAIPVVAVNVLYSPRRPPKTVDAAEQCVRYTTGRPATRIVFVRPTDEPSRLLYEVSEAEQGMKGAGKLAKINNRVKHAIEEDCISPERARTMIYRMRDRAMPQLFEVEQLPDPKSKALPFLVTRLPDPKGSVIGPTTYAVGYCRKCGHKVFSLYPVPQEFCADCEKAA